MVFQNFHFGVFAFFAKKMAQKSVEKTQFYAYF